MGPRARLGALGGRRLDRRSRRGGAIRKGGAEFHREYYRLCEGRVDRSLRRPDARLPQEIRKSCISAAERRRGSHRLGRRRRLPVEISSAGLRKPSAIYRRSGCSGRLIAAGIPVTFSSDAHAPAEWGGATSARSRRAGSPEHAFVTFEKRRKVFHPLPGVASTRTSKDAGYEISAAWCFTSLAWAM
jgi:hypothetical protein